MFGLLGEAVPTKEVNLLKTAPTQQKTSAKVTEQLRGCPLVPEEVALPCPGSQPGPHSSCSSLATGSSPGWKTSLLGRHFPKGATPQCVLEEIEKKVDFFLKSMGALLCCAEPRSSPGSGSSAGMGSVPPLPPPVSCNLLSPPSPPPKLAFSRTPIARS